MFEKRLQFSTFAAQMASIKKIKLLYLTEFTLNQPLSFPCFVESEHQKSLLFMTFSVDCYF